MNKSCLPYYKRYPRDFVEGTIGMPFEVKTTYSFLLDLIYMQGGYLPDDPRYIAGLLAVSVRKWKSLREQLIGFGKIQVSGEFLTNYRALSELETLAKLQDKQRENRSGPNKNKDLQSPRFDHPEPEPEYTLEANASNDDASAVFSQPIDARREAIWKRGVPFLVERGVPEPQARSCIGRWLRDHGSDALFSALRTAAEAGTHDPIPYITRALEPEPLPDVAAMVRAATEALTRAN